MFNGLDHLCIVTSDVDRVVRTWADGFGVGPWQVYEFDETNMTTEVDGEARPFAMRVGLCQVGPAFRVEVIQPLDDRSPYAASLDAHGGADHLHHVKLDVADFEQASEALGARGLKVTFDGVFPGDVGVAHGRYFDATADLGFLLEISEVSPGFTMAPPEYEYQAGAPAAPGV
jgi:methylmalonyl-CoA/ethylmalonyl-CoA epimerase